jgi:hypothetical protein
MGAGGELITKALNLQVQLKVVNYFTGWEIISISRKTLLCGVK